MTEADILALTYEDSCTVYRPYKEELPSGETGFFEGLEGRVIYDAVPCSLSTPTGGKLQRGQTVNRAESEYCLFTRPEIDVEPGDTLLVHRLGKELEALAGRAERHSSHNNIPLILRKEDA